MTEKQKVKIDKIITHFGREYAQSYIRYFDENADLMNLNKSQAQKIITGLMHRMPRRPITGVYLRDVFT